MKHKASAVIPSLQAWRAIRQQASSDGPCACYEPCCICGARETENLLHWAESEPYVIRQGRAIPIFNLLPRNDPKYAWMHEAPWLFQLGALCFACAERGERFHRCFEGGAYHEFAGELGGAICRHCGERV